MRLVRAGVVLTLGASALACGRNAGPVTAAPPPAPVVVGHVVRRDVAVSLRSIGNVRALATVDVRAQVDGKVLAVKFALLRFRPAVAYDWAPRLGAYAALAFVVIWVTSAWAYFTGTL